MLLIKSNFHYLLIKSTEFRIISMGFKSQFYHLLKVILGKLFNFPGLIVIIWKTEN